MVELRILGSLNLLRDGSEIPALITQPKRFALLAHLALTPAPGFRRRDTLVALFWPELSDAHARAALRQSMHVIRRTIGVETIVSRGSEEIGIDRRALWCDAAAFEQHARAGQHEAAVALYGGPLLDGLFLSDTPAFEEWLEDRRAALCREAARSLWALSAAAEDARDAQSAVHWARRAFALAPDDENAAARLLAVLMRAGDRCGAVREYDHFARRLRRDYGIEPSLATRSIIDELRDPALAARGGVLALR